MAFIPYESGSETLKSERPSISGTGLSVCSKWKPTKAIHGKIVYEVSNGLTTIGCFKTREQAEGYVEYVNWLRKK